MKLSNYFSQLIGYKITSFHMEADEFGGQDFPVYTLEKNGTKITATISQDEEGNGGGFIFLEETK